MGYSNPVQGKLREGSRYVQVKTADYTVTPNEAYGGGFTNTGAAGTITFSLPAAKKGMNLEFRVGVAQQLRIDPNGTETISLPSTGVPGAAGKYLWADAIGESVRLECFEDGSWTAVGAHGTWSAEA